jgi:hypothetical protein
VDLQRHLLAAEDEVGLRGRALRRGQQLLRLGGDPLGVAGQVQRADQLPAPGAVLPADPRVRPALRLAGADGGRVHRRAALPDVLLDARALAGHEPLRGVPHLVCGLGERHARGPHGRGDPGDQVALLAQRDAERVLLARAGPPVLPGLDGDQLQAGAGDETGGPGDRGRLLAGPARGGVGGVRHRDEAPGRADQRPHADADGLALHEVLDGAVLGRHRLVPQQHAAGVRVPRAGRERRLDGCGGQVEHG